MKPYLHYLPYLLIFSLLTFAVLDSRADYQTLQSKVLRLHIRADGNDTYSQNLKLLVRDQVLEVMTPLFAQCESRDDAISCAQNNLSLIQQTALEALRSQGCNLPVSVQVQKTYFPYRQYDGDTYPPGIYQAVNIKIGSGKGHNWWCVLYPKLCLTDVCTDSNSSLTICTDSDAVAETLPAVKKPLIRFRYLRFLNCIFE
ncbi:MAG: stage II sporulation protein R [Lachnospiraceae bacterium]